MTTVPITNADNRVVGSISIDADVFNELAREGIAFEIKPIRTRRTDTQGFPWEVVGFDILPQEAVRANPKVGVINFQQVVEHETNLEKNEVTIRIKMVKDEEGFAKAISALRLYSAPAHTVDIPDSANFPLGTVITGDPIPTWAQIDDENIDEINTTMEFREQEGMDPGVVDESGHTTIGESDPLVIKDGESKIIIDFGKDEVT